MIWLFPFILAPVFLFLPGFLLGGLIWRKEGQFSFGEGILMSIALSFLLSYPLGFLNNVVEQFMKDGQPFQVHFDTLFPLYGILILAFAFFQPQRKWFKIPKKLLKNPWTWTIVGLFVVAAVARLWGIEHQNINGDEQELSLYAYHLVDGMTAGRNALFLSQSGHSPLGFYVSFVIYQVLSPWSYDAMTQEWMLRMPMLVFGLLEFALWFLYADKFKLNKALTVSGALLLALSNYAIFGSRLMIPQDGSVFTFFVLFFLYLFIHFLSAKKKISHKEIAVLSLFFGACFLVKFSAIVLVPAVMILWFLGRQKLSGFLKATAGTLLVFSPVIAFNIAAYLKTGYTDVPFAKVFNFLGIPAQSIMQNEDLYSSTFPPFFETLLGFSEMLMDQWGILFFAVFVVAFIAIAIQKNRVFEYQTLLVLIVVTFIFFSLNGYRAYYAEYLTIPALLLILSGLKFNKAALYFVLFFILAESVLVTCASQWKVLDPRTEIGEFGRNDLYTWEELSNFQSYASWGFLRDHGFKALQTEVADEPLLVIDDIFLDQYLHHFRWYLGIHKDVDAYYLGDSYSERPYQRISEYSGERPGILILQYEEEAALSGDTIVKNHNGTSTMLLRPVPQ